MLAETGAEIAGAAVGGALGLLGGPAGVGAGAVSGVVATRVLKRVGAEIQERLWGSRQRVRVGAAFVFAADEIRARLAAGDTPRDDGFFSSTQPHPSAAELLEGVLLAAADTYEERKVKHFGWLYASLVFDTSVDPAGANYLLRVARGLTYRQLCDIAFFVSPTPEGVFALLDGAREGGASTMTDLMAAELDDLGQSGILGFRQQTGGVARPSTTLGGGDFRHVALENIGVTDIGAQLNRLMRLERIPEAHLADVRRELGALS